MNEPLTGEALAHLRHELRTPINHILGYTEILLEDADDTGLAEFSAALREMNAGGRAMLEAIQAALAESSGGVSAAQLEALSAKINPQAGRMLAAAERLAAGLRNSGNEDAVTDIDRVAVACRRLISLVAEMTGAAPEPPPVEPEAVPSASSKPAHAATAAEGAGRILVVEDNAANRDLLRRRLERENHQVWEAANGVEALAMLAADDYDLMLLDLIMPEMDGFEVLARLKQDSRRRDLPVIMISALDEIQSVVRCIEMGAEDYLPKPFNPVLLRARIGASLEKKHLRDREQLYLKSLERELEIGREIQAGFLPTELPQAPGWEIAASLKSAREVAGDFYDAFYLESERKICLVIADVCDKGVGAALFMTLCRSLLRFTMGVTDALRERSPAARLSYAVTLTNRYIANTHGDTGMFATIFIGLLDPATGNLTYINAGHECPLVVDIEKHCTPLTRTGPAVGVVADTEFMVQDVRLDPGDLLFAFTDGVPDALNSAGHTFGHERLTSFLQGHTYAGTLVPALHSALDRYTAGTEQFDDITLVVVHHLSHT
jgi:serine phosphatase RsbU (regulator of sigma subunit)